MLNALQPVDDDEDDDDSRQEHTGDSEEWRAGQSSGAGSMAQLAKGLVRYALACEYARVPIKRQDVSHKGALGRYRQRGAEEGAG